jgi:hypothetical protein
VGDAWGAVGGMTLFKTAVVDPARQVLTDRIVSARFRPGLANLWRISRRRRT